MYHITIKSNHMFFKYTIHGYTWIEWVIIQPLSGCVLGCWAPPRWRLLYLSNLSIHEHGRDHGQVCNGREEECLWTNREGGNNFRNKNHLWETDEKPVRQGLKPTGRGLLVARECLGFFCYRWSGCGFQLLYPIRSMYGLYLPIHVPSLP